MASKECLACGHENPAATGEQYEACPACGRIYSRAQAALDARAELEVRRARGIKRRSPPPRPDPEPSPARAPAPAPEPEQAVEPPPAPAVTAVASSPAAPRGSNLAACLDCGGQVSKSAEACPHCGVKRVTTDQTAGAVVGLIVAVVILFWIFSPSSPTPAPDYCKGGGKAAARVMAQQFVKERLRSPASAVFSNDHATYRFGCSYQVSGAVDSQNGFGALIRSSYTADLVYRRSDDHWELHNMVLE